MDSVQQKKYCTIKRLIKYLIAIVFVFATFTAKPQMIFDTLNLVEMEIISQQFEFDEALRTQEIDTITKKELNHLSLAELLSAGSMVFVKSYGKGSLATAAFRGTAASHSKVLWNGFQINSPMLGQVDLSQIPNIFYDKAELEYGGSSLQVTSGALGGSINLKSDNSSPNLLAFTQTGGSFNSYTSSLKICLGGDKLKSATSVYFNTSKNSFTYFNNAIIPPEWQTQKNASYNNKGFTQGFDYKISNKHSLSFISWNQWNFREIPAIMSNQQGAGNKEEQESFTSRNIFKWLYQKENTKIETRAAWFYENMSYLLKTSTANNPYDTVTFINSTNFSNSGFFKTKLSQNLKLGWILNAEFSFTRSTVKSNNYNEIKNREVYSLLVNVSKDFNDFLKGEALLRQEFVDNEFLPLIPLLAFSIKPLKSEELYFRLSGNLNYNLPSLNDLYWFPGGNLNLIPEQGVQFDVGLNYSQQFFEQLKIRADLSFFSSQISNWIQWVPGDYRYWQAENIAFVHARGIEAGLNVNGKINNLFYKFSVQYSYNKSTNESTEAVDGGYAGRQLIYVPLHSGNAFLFMVFRKYQFNWSTQIAGKRNTLLNQETLYSNVLPAYSLSNISLGRDFDFNKWGLGLKLKVNNIFNTTYQAILWRPMPGRSYEVFLTIKIK